MNTVQNLLFISVKKKYFRNKFKENCAGIVLRMADGNCTQNFRCKISSLATAWEKFTVS
jgi:hypothetical protein